MGKRVAEKGRTWLRWPKLHRGVTWRRKNGLGVRRRKTEPQSPKGATSTAYEKNNPESCVPTYNETRTTRNTNPLEPSSFRRNVSDYTVFCCCLLLLLLDVCSDSWSNPLESFVRHTDALLSENFRSLLNWLVAGSMRRCFSSCIPYTVVSFDFANDRKRIFCSDYL